MMRWTLIMSVEKYLKFYYVLHNVFGILEFGGVVILLNKNSCDKAVTTCCYDASFHFFLC